MKLLVRATLLAITRVGVLAGPLLGLESRCADVPVADADSAVEPGP